MVSRPRFPVLVGLFKDFLTFLRLTASLFLDRAIILPARGFPALDLCSEWPGGPLALLCELRRVVPVRGLAALGERAFGTG